MEKDFRKIMVTIHTPQIIVDWLDKNTKKHNVSRNKLVTSILYYAKEENDPKKYIKEE